jgi:hypothetical protein
MLSDNPFDAAPAPEQAPSIERARYWFDQYRFASGWEARLIRAIRDLSADHERRLRELE